MAALTTLLLGLAAPTAADPSLAVGAGASIDLGTGALDLGGSDLSVEGTFSAGATGIDVGSVAIQPAGILNGDAALIRVCGDWSNAGTFNAGTSTVAFVDGCTASSTISGDNTFENLDLTTQGGRSIFLEAGATQTVATTFGIGGTAGSLLTLRSTIGGSEAYLDLAVAATGDFVDVDDVHAVDQKLTLGDGSVFGPNLVGIDPLATVIVPAVGVLGLLTLASGILATGRRRARLGAG